MVRIPSATHRWEAVETACAVNSVNCSPFGKGGLIAGWASARHRHARTVILSEAKNLLPGCRHYFAIIILHYLRHPLLSVFICGSETQKTQKRFTGNNGKNSLAIIAIKCRVGFNPPFQRHQCTSAFICGSETLKDTKKIHNRFKYAAGSPHSVV